MSFSKSFPRTVKESSYPHWEEVYLSEEEEREMEKKCRDENIKLMQQCLEDAKKIFFEKNLKDFQSDIVNVAISLFEKRASHQVYLKENRAKEKFDTMYGDNK